MLFRKLDVLYKNIVLYMFSSDTPTRKLIMSNDASPETIRLLPEIFFNTMKNKRDVPNDIELDETACRFVRKYRQLQMVKILHVCPIFSFISYVLYIVKRILSPVLKNY